MIIRDNNGGITVELKDLRNFDKCAHYIKKHNVTEVHFMLFENIPFWKDRDKVWDLSFIKNLEPEQIRILSLTGNCSGYDNLYQFINLEELVFSPKNDEVIDLSKFPKLKELACDTLRCYINLSQSQIKNLIIFEPKIDYKKLADLKNLEILNMECDKKFSFDKLASLKRLKELCLSFFKLENLNGIEVLENLEKLSIFRARNLSDIFELQKLKKLKKLKFDACPNVTDFKIFREKSLNIEIL